MFRELKMNISKRASQVIIQPWDGAVNAAKQMIDRLDPMLLKNVKRIVVHPGGGGGQLGHVEMGPGKDPQEVHVFKDRVKEHVMRNANATVKTTLTTQELEQAIVNGIMEVIAHEAGHIGRHRTPEQIAQQPFFGEPEAEREAKEFMRKVQHSTFDLSKRAAMFKAPPKIIEDATNWALAYYAKGILNSRLRGSEELFELAMKDFERFESDEDSVPIDLTGWKYENLVKDKENMPNEINLKWENYYMAGMAGGEEGVGGSWDPRTYTLRIGVEPQHTYPYSVEHYKIIRHLIELVVAHELMHLGQQLLGDKQGAKWEELEQLPETPIQAWTDEQLLLSWNKLELFEGRESDRQKVLEEIRRRVKHPDPWSERTESMHHLPGYPGIKMWDRTKEFTLHALHDWEFYPRIWNEAKIFKTLVDLGRRSSTRQDVFEFIKDRDFWIKLRRHNPEKFKKAIKEFIKAVESETKSLDAEDVLVEASMMLDDLRKKFAPNHPMVEPNLEFVLHVANNDIPSATREAINIFKSGCNEPVMFRISDAISFNKETLRSQSFLKTLGVISNTFKTKNFDNIDFIVNLAAWQLSNGLAPTGKLDAHTIKKFAMGYNIQTLPKNFGVVTPGLVYRGGMIVDEGQMQNLKNLGIERVISLHPSPDIARLCNRFGIEHIPAFMENGAPEDLGRKILGNNVADFLNEKPTYVHCFYGQDRTGGVIARYRTENGWPCKQAYREAKAHGFKDMFVDLIDWFSEPCGERPIDTDKLRRMLGNREPYQNPELTEQEAFDLPTPAPDDVPYPETPGYTVYVTSPTPTGILSIPSGRGSQAT